MFLDNSYCAGGKIKSFLCLTKHYETMTFVTEEEKFFLFLSPVLDGSDCSASLHDNFNIGENIPVTHWVRS
jgi:hypothetical protein